MINFSRQNDLLNNESSVVSSIHFNYISIHNI